MIFDSKKKNSSDKLKEILAIESERDENLKSFLSISRIVFLSKKDSVEIQGDIIISYNIKDKTMFLRSTTSKRYPINNEFYLFKKFENILNKWAEENYKDYF